MKGIVRVGEGKGESLSPGDSDTYGNGFGISNCQHCRVAIQPVYVRLGRVLGKKDCQRTGAAAQIEHLHPPFQERIVEGRQPVKA